MTKQVVDSTTIEFTMSDGNTLAIHATAYMIGEEYYATADHYIVRSDMDYDYKRGNKKYSSMVDAIRAIADKYQISY
jgi:hypothetical protein